MSAFQRKRTQYQNRLSQLWNEKKELKIMVSKFIEKEDMEFLLQEFDKYKNKTHYIELYNLLTLVSEKDFIKKIKEKKSIWSKIKKLFTSQEYGGTIRTMAVKIYLEDEFWEYETVKKIYNGKVLHDKWTSVENYLFMKYFIKHDDKDLFTKAFLLSLEVKSRQTKFLHGIEEYVIAYIGKYDELFDLYLENIKDNGTLIIDFFKTYIIATHETIIKEFSDPQKNNQKILFKYLEKVSKKSFLNIKKIFLKMLQVDPHWTDYHFDIREIQESDFFFALLIFIKNKDTSFFEEFVKILLEGKVRLDQIIRKMSWIMNIDDIDTFYKADFGEINYPKRYLYDYIKDSNRKKKRELLERIETYLWKESILKREKHIREQRKALQANQEKQENKEKQDIQTAINRIREHSWYHPWLIREYVENEAAFKKYHISNKEVKEQVIKILSEKKDILPENREFHITKQEEWRSTYTTNSFVWTMSDCIQLAVKRFKIDINQYKYKIITYLPYTYGEDVNLVLENITALWEKEVDYLLGIYSKERDKKDDLRRHSPYIFISIYTRYQTLFEKYWKGKAKGILKELLEWDRDTIWYDDKGRILDILKDKEKSTYFKWLFNKLVDKNLNYFNDILDNEAIYDNQVRDNYKVAIKINDILIHKFKDQEAIKWKINQLLESNIIIASKYDWEIHNVTAVMHEIERDKDFIKTIKDIKDKDRKYKKKFLKLLEHSFILSKNNKDNKLVWYLWEAIHLYFKNIWYQKWGTTKEIEEICKKYPEESPFFASTYLSVQKKNEKIEISRSKYDKEIEARDKLKLELSELKALHDELKKIRGPLLIVEWKTDKIILQEAYKKLYKWANTPFTIIDGGWAWTVLKLLESYNTAYKSCYWDEIPVFWLFDFDQEGYKQWKILFNWENKEITPDWTAHTCFFKKAERKKIYGMLLPVPENWEIKTLALGSKKKEGIPSNTELKENIEETTTESLKHDAKLPIEMLLYYAWINNILFKDAQTKECYFVKWLTAWWWEIRLFNCTDKAKTNFAGKITNNTSLEIPRENFKPIFEFIKKHKK